MIPTEQEKTTIENNTDIALSDRKMLTKLALSQDYFWDLWQHYQERLFKFSYRLTQNFHDAEDLCSDCMLKAYHKLPDAALDTNLSAWLYRMLKNTYFDRYRSNLVHLKSQEKYAEMDKSQKEEKSKIKTIIDTEISGFIKSEILRLPKLMSCVAIDYYINEIIYKELSKKYNKKEATLRKITFDTRKILLLKIRNL